MRQGRDEAARVRRAGPMAAIVALWGVGCGPSAPADAPSEVRDAVAACGSLAGPAKQDCYEERLLTELDRGGVQPALALLEGVAAADREVERDGHVYTHAIGINAYAPDASFAETFEECTSLFQSGCYHGVIQSFFIDQGVADRASVQALCEPYHDDPADRWVLFQCLHGLGHGLTMFYGHNLPRALEDCDHLTSSWDRESCYGGAFMENVVNATNPHHSATEMVAEALGDQSGAGGGEAAMEGGGTGMEHDDHGMEHDHGPVAAAAADLPPWEPLREDDPHYPCSVLEDRYQTACYMMQTSAMLHMNGGDIGDAVEACGEAPEAWRRTCFQSLGRDISSRTLQEPGPSLRECQRSPEEYRPWCYVGLVKNFIDLTATTDAAFDFCGRVEDFAEGRCYEAIGEEIGILHASLDDRRDACQAAESYAMVTFCLRGARVPTP